MFENITVVPADPILGPVNLFHADDCPEKISLGIGVYENETGKTPVLTNVKKVEQYLLESKTTKSCPSIDDIPEFGRYTQELLFGKDNAIIADKCIHTVQAPGDTDALRVTVDFLVKNIDMKRMWVSSPSWPNHKNVFISVELEVHEYTYYDAANHAPDFEGLLASLTEAQAGDVVLFHGYYHNPTGIDPTLDQWQQLVQLLAERDWLPLFDFIYQGSVRGLEEDAEGLRAFTTLYKELLVASSYLKNFGLYDERVGACTLVAADQGIVDRALSQMKSVIYTNYSNLPAYGAFVAATTLSSDALCTVREQEPIDIRQRVQCIRLPFVNTLQEKGANRDFSFISQQGGMFSFSGLTKKQVLRLHEGFTVYAIASGCISVAGMTSDNMAPLCETIAAVL